MAEFCLGCFNRLNRSRLTEQDAVLSREEELCEGCGRICRVVEGRRRRYPFFSALIRRLHSFRKGR